MHYVRPHTVAQLHAGAAWSFGLGSQNYMQRWRSLSRRVCKHLPPYVPVYLVKRINLVYIGHSSCPPAPLYNTQVQQSHLSEPRPCLYRVYIANVSDRLALMAVCHQWRWSQQDAYRVTSRRGTDGPVWPHAQTGLTYKHPCHPLLLYLI